MSKCKLYIMSRGRVFDCTVESGVVWETHLEGSPGKLTFNVIKDDVLGFFEGDAVRFEYDGHKIFFGFVFTKKRTDNRMINVVAYDQLRYFKNKDTYTYKNKTAAQVLLMLCKDFKLQTGVITDTKYVIKSRVEDNQELFGITSNAIALTTHNTGSYYVLYDDYGAISLCDIKQMQLDLLIDEDSGETFEYTTSIDEETYTKIKLTRENKKTGKREVFIAADYSNNWGVLQYTDKLEDGENGKTKAEQLLKMYNRKTRKLHINGVFGDRRVRGGSSLGVQLYLGDMTVANFMIVKTAKHTFENEYHYMDLNVIGGEFLA